MALFESVITSIRLAVKLAMYNTPRVGSRAISDASPPIGTTVPKVPALREAAIIPTLAIARIQCLRNIRKLHIFSLTTALNTLLPNNKYAARGLLPRIGYRLDRTREEDALEALAAAP